MKLKNAVKKNAKPKARVVGTAKPKNKIILLLDSSGSMQTIARPAIDAFNQILGAISDGAAASNQETTVSLYTFGECSIVKRKFFDVPILAVDELDDISYQPDGQTPMYDCIGDAITDALSLNVDDKTSFVLNVITDGEENFSKEYTRSSIQKLIKKVQGTDRWTVTFSVPRGRKRSVVELLNLHDGNVQEWDQTAEGAAHVAQSFTRGYDSYFSARSQGKSKIDGFFVTDMSKVKTKDVKRKLDNVANNYVTLHVPREDEIRPFVLRHGLPYVRGDSFYQLTKDEKVQPYKKILLREKGQSAIYGGDEARELLGFPAKLTVEVRPGNHANWDIFVQSTSFNRKLVRGTDLLVLRG